MKSFFACRLMKKNNGKPQMLRKLKNSVLGKILLMLLCLFVSCIAVYFLMLVFYLFKPNNSFVYNNLKEIDSLIGYSYDSTQQSKTYLDINGSLQNMDIKNGDYRLTCENARIDGKNYKECTFILEDTEIIVGALESSDTVNVSINGSIASMNQHWSDYWETTEPVLIDQYAKYNNVTADYFVKCDQDKFFIQGLYNNTQENVEEEYDENDEGELSISSNENWGELSVDLNSKDVFDIQLFSGYDESGIKIYKDETDKYKLIPFSSFEATNVSIETLDGMEYRMEFQFLDGDAYIYNLTDLEVSGIGDTKLSCASNITNYDNIFQNLRIKADSYDYDTRDNAFATIIKYKDGVPSEYCYGNVKEAYLSGRSIINNFRDWLFLNTYLAPVSMITIIFSGVTLFLSLLKNMKDPDK